MYKSSCALTVHAISHYSPDVLKGHAGVALPLAFLGMHQAAGPDEEKGECHDATLWAEVWQDNVPGIIKCNCFQLISVYNFNPCYKSEHFICHQEVLEASGST